MMHVEDDDHEFALNETCSVISDFEQILTISGFIAFNIANSETIV